MKNITNSPIFTSVIMTLGFIAMSHNSVNAQSIGNNQQPQPFQSNEVNPMHGTSGFNPMQLIHNANFFNSRTGEEFVEDTNKNIDSAAQDFRQQQLQRMMEMQKQQQSTPSQTIDNQQ
ncbi:hypothetical protein ACN4EE_06570 [Geminocystis sp. CENA526]|uniref:hypothetical protein n=1 Tax=Geminocystis sp. CENA526 TaxID=1355871 RepID=UPI003D6DCADC